MTLGDLHRAYLEDRARYHRPDTIRSKAGSLDQWERFLREMQGGRPLGLEALSKELLGSFYDWLRRPDGSNRTRSAGTVRKYIIDVQVLWAWAAEHDRFAHLVGRPRRLDLPPYSGSHAIAPTWAEMDAVIRACESSAGRRLLILLRCTGLRVSQAERLEWTDLDLTKATLAIRPELGKSAHERRGRTVPISPHLVEALTSWPREDARIITPGRYRRRIRRAWRETEARPELFSQRPNHAFRKGFATELKLLGADSEAVEYLIGHSAGIRNVYVDPRSLPLVAAVALVPALPPDLTGEP